MIERHDTDKVPLDAIRLLLEAHGETARFDDDEDEIELAPETLPAPPSDPGQPS